MRNGPMFWGAGFVTLGLALLLRQFGVQLPFLTAFIPFWPVVIIIIGLMILTRHTRYRPYVSLIAGIAAGMWIAGMTQCNNCHLRYHVSSNDHQIELLRQQ